MLKSLLERCKKRQIVQKEPTLNVADSDSGTFVNTTVAAHTLRAECEEEATSAASPKIGGEKCLILGKLCYFVWDTASQGTK